MGDDPVGVNLSDFTHLIEKLDSKKCVLAEFTNVFDDHANPLLSIGYSKWITDKKVQNDVESKDSKHIKDGKCISMMWPVNIDIEPATNKSFRNKLKNCFFEINSVQILAYGTWDDMKKKQKNMMKYDSLDSPNKLQRHDLKKKMYGDDYDKSTTRKSKTEVSSSAGSNSKQKCSDGNEDLLKEINESSKAWDVHSIGSLNDFEEEEESSSDEQIKIIEERDRLLKSKENECKELKIQVEKLTNDLTDKEGKNLSILKENEKLLNKIKQLDEKNKQTEEKMKMLSSIERDLKQAGDLILNSIDYIKSKKPLREINSEMDENSPQKRQHSSIKDEDRYDPELSSTSNKKPKKETPRNEYSNPANMKFKGLLPTSIKITENDAAGLPRKNIEQLTKALLNKYFTPEELADHSCTGIACNASGKIPKPALDIERFNAIRNYIYTQYGQKKNWSSLMRYAARNTMSGHRKSLGRYDEENDGE